MIQQLTPEAKLARTFRLPDDVPGIVGAGFVDHDGTVYMAVNGPKGIAVIEFAHDGSVKSQTRLQLSSYAQVWHLTVL